MGPQTTFDQLLREGAEAPVDGWGFSWLEGRATEQRPSWGYLRLMSHYMARAGVAVDVQTGGGEVLAEVPVLAPVTKATEGWPPNVEIARRTLEPRGVRVVEVGESEPFPFADESFDLVVSRHPSVVLWNEIGRIVKPGGCYLSQQIGSGSNRELTEFFIGPQVVGEQRRPELARANAQAAGLVVDELREESLTVRFHDLAAVIYFVRKVVWTVPDFSIDKYYDRLKAMHEHIEREGAFVSHAYRFLLRAHKPLQ